MSGGAANARSGRVRKQEAPVARGLLMCALTAEQWKEENVIESKF
jgi:hypothetical protein